MKNKKERFLYVLWIVITIFVFGLIGLLGRFSAFQNFFQRIEAITFDIRQNIISHHKTHNNDIVIIAIDDASYEYIMDKDNWPLSRQVWADTIQAIEKVNPKYIIFDLLFVKTLSGDEKSDLALAKEAKQHNNTFFAMNFDTYSDEIRLPQNLEDKFKMKIKENNLKNIFFYSYTNLRSPIKPLVEATKNIGSINVQRDKDGLIRTINSLYVYKNDLYPNLGLLVALDILNQEEISLKNNSIIIDKNHTIPLENDGSAVLNWYGKSNTFKNIPYWKVLKAIKENDISFIETNFKDKIIYIGTTANGLSDIKSVPVDYGFTGVEIHATYLNNILDNNFIKKVSLNVDIIISIFLCVIVGFAVLRIQNIGKTFIFLFLIIGIYLLFATFVMEKFNLWLAIWLPMCAIILTFTGVYIEKYLLVIKDYEQTYQLAVTDGLTQLYNHRYFQEQMIFAVNNYHRYGNKFSLILIDIDFFKKFNDLYGHQSGDCVLKQVANILKRNSRTSDIVCRYGGEEMAIILLNTNKEEAIITANKICNTIRKNKFSLSNGEGVGVTISIGVATIGHDGNQAQELIEYSDKCLYKAKENGRNQVCSEI